MSFARVSDACNHAKPTRHHHTVLWQDVQKSCITIHDWIKKSYHVEARLYKVCPACFLLFVNDLLFVEHYHFGAGGRASGKVPLMKIARGSELYRQFEGHFAHVWDTSRTYAFNEELFGLITKPDAARAPDLIAALEASRPDLFLPRKE